MATIKALDWRLLLISPEVVFRAGGTCGGLLASGNNCTIEVAYAPTVTSTNDNTSLNINYNDVAAQILSVNLIAQAHALPI